MHGLNVSQSAYYAAPVDQTTFLFDTQLAVFKSFSCGTPDFLNTNLSGQNVLSDDDIYIKRCLKQLFITNTGSYPNHFEITWLRARKDIPATKTMVSILQDNAPPMNYPFISCLTGKDFQSLFKITKSKRFVLRPLRSIKLTLKQHFGTKKVIGSADRDPNWNWRRGNAAIIIRAWGTPTNTGNNTYSTILTGVKFATAVHDYLSYYKMNDVEPNSVVLTSMTPTVEIAERTVTNTEVIGDYSNNSNVVTQRVILNN